MQNQTVCQVSGANIFLSDAEAALRKKLNAPLPRTLPRYTFQQLLAFWQHFAMHRRKCDLSQHSIISVFDEHCPYPVWHRDDWIRRASPPSAQFNFQAPFFDQLWSLFQRCPIPHNIGAGNENCEYTDDWWYSKNCYLCHSGVNCEDCRACYRIVRLRDCQYCVFSFDCEVCAELVNCHRCYSSLSLVSCQNCTECAFLFDCRNCSDCLWCWNLRNKQYCIENQQLSKEEYFRRRRALDFSSRKHYDQYYARFQTLAHDYAYWKAVEIELCTDSWGSYIENDKNCENVYFLQESEDCINYIRGYRLKDNLDSVGNLTAELVYLSVLAQDNCYDIRCCVDVMQCRMLEYSAHCFQCQNCFGCCGLVGKEYCILNRQFTKAEYSALTGRIREKIEADGLAGAFFPPYFAASVYDESLAAVHFPLTSAEQAALGFRTYPYRRERPSNTLDRTLVPDSAAGLDLAISETVFWDELCQRPFQITRADLNFAAKLPSPLPNFFYVRKLQELFRWMPFSGELRETRCAISQEPVLTHLPLTLDCRIVSPVAHRTLVA